MSTFDVRYAQVESLVNFFFDKLLSEERAP
jgi:hypothetical protein